MQFRIDTLDIAQRNRFVQQLLVEWRRKSAVKTMTMEYSNAKNATDKMKIRQMIRIYT